METYSVLASPGIVEWLQVAQDVAGGEDIDLLSLHVDTNEFVANATGGVNVAILSWLNNTVEGLALERAGKKRVRNRRESVWNVILLDVAGLGVDTSNLVGEEGVVLALQSISNSSRTGQRTKYPDSTIWSGSDITRTRKRCQCIVVCELGVSSRSCAACGQQSRTSSDQRGTHGVSREALRVRWALGYGIDRRSFTKRNGGVQGGWHEIVLIFPQAETPRTDANR